jgi:hypothetical protein
MRGAWLALLVTGLAASGLLIAPAGLAKAAPAWGAARQPATAAGQADGPEVVLINQPVRTVCTGHRFKVGVWFQRISGGSRAYRVAVSGPRHRRFFYRAGKAPSSHWLFWKVLAGRSGMYRTVYSSHKPGSKKWNRFVATTRARRCDGR